MEEGEHEGGGGGYNGRYARGELGVGVVAGAEERGRGKEAPAIEV